MSVLILVIAPVSCQMEQNITIRIADAAPINTKVPAESEEIVRKAAHNVNKLWKAWQHSYSGRDSKDIIAMVAFQFARRYYQLLEQVESRQDILEEFEKELDRLLDLTVEK